MSDELDPTLEEYVLAWKSAHPLERECTAHLALMKEQRAQTAALESIARSLEKLVEARGAGPVPRSLEVATEEASAAFRGAMERRG